MCSLWNMGISFASYVTSSRWLQKSQEQGGLPWFSWEAHNSPTISSRELSFDRGPVGIAFLPFGPINGVQLRSVIDHQPQTPEGELKKKSKLEIWSQPVGISLGAFGQYFHIFVWPQGVYISRHHGWFKTYFLFAWYCWGLKCLTFW